MHFAPDTEDVLEFNVALVNTGAGASRSGEDELSTRAELKDLLDSFAFSGRFDRDDAELASVQGVRAELRRIWTHERDLLAAEVNRMLADSVSSPRLVRHDALDWHLHATSDDAPLADRIRVESALALVDVIRTDETGRLRACAADDCDGVFVDLSRNGSKRFCSVRCGNRVNMIAFRERRADVD